MRASTAPDWRASASLATLQRRAQLLAATRQFFAARAVLEVDTPMVINAPVSDVHLHSARVTFANDTDAFYLHTSPEYAMKRLLADGTGDIYQICHVVRARERGRLHNPEFTLVEWYRLGWDLNALIEEVDALVRVLLGPRAPARPLQRISYQQAFLEHVALDPFTATHAELTAAARAAGFAGAAAERDELLELLMSLRVGPKLGRTALTFVHGYPASQAALARLDPADPRTALRFELYCEGVELANGFHELGDAAEQRARFERDLTARRRLGLGATALDERLLAALAAGLPECCGVALGFDRTVMLAIGADSIDAALAFPLERA
jgi:lysyl-tRNA synthetase class 2